MNKFLMAGIVAAMAAATSVATASPLVTANVPLDSRYYRYIDKLEGMGYIKDMPTGTRPYSRLDMAKWIMEAQHKAQTKPMPGYLKTYYEEMRADLAEEIAYLQGANTDLAATSSCVLSKPGWLMAICGRIPIATVRVSMLPGSR